MARPIWTGTVGFGLVNVPVKLFTAVTEKTVRFNQLNAETGARIRQKKVDEQTGEEVANDKIVKGYQLGDHYVTVDPSELDALAPAKTKAITLDKFVPLAEIDPMIYDKSYYLAPGDGGEKAYDLLTAAIEDAGMVGIGTVILRSKEKLAAIRAREGVLICSTLMFDDEINDAPDAGRRQAEYTDAELAMATQLIGSLTGDFDHSEYHDEHRAQVVDLLERKAAGQEFEAPEVAPLEPAPPDLMAALEASLLANGDTAKPKKKASAKKRAKVAA